MIYYVYFDAYGHAGKAVSEIELAAAYQNSTAVFFKHMCATGKNQSFERATGHVGTLCLHDEDELKAFLDALGDEISNFYECGDGSRPYNF